MSSWFVSLAQTSVIIGTGTFSTTSYGPIYRSSSTSTIDYSRYQYLYVASELSAIPPGSMITEIAWYKVSTFATNPPATFQIYLKNSSTTSLTAGTAWTTAISGATMVYSNTNQTISTATGWIPFATTPFIYTGQSLEVSVNWDISIPSPASTGAINWQYSTGIPSGRVIGSASSIVPTNLSSSYIARPNIRITYVVPSYPDMAVTNVTPVTPIVGTNVVQATLANYGGTNLNGTPVTLSYSTDGGTTWTTPESFTPTTLGTTGSTQTFTFATPWNITSGGSYNLCARINPPGVSGDGMPSNDQFCRSVCTGYGGTYTVGGTAPDFPTLTAAIAALSSCGISAPTTLNIRPGIYNEQVNIPPILGMSSTNTLTIQSESGDSTSVTITYASSSSTAYHTIRFNGGSYITLSKLTIEATGTYARPIEFNANSSNVTITNSRIFAPVTTSSLRVPIYASTTSPNNNITITNNLIKGGYYAIYGRFGTSTTTPANNITIRNNKITDYYYYGIYGYYLNGIDFSQNHISGASSTSSFRYGMYLGYCGSTLAGLIEKNYIVNGGSYGLYMFSTSGGGTSTPLNIRNNMIAGFSGTSTVWGIYSSACNYVNFYFNSVRLNSGTSTSTSALYIGSGNNINVVNNILSYNGTGSGYSLYKSTAATLNSCDYNCYYSTSTSLAYWNSAVADLAALQTASSTNNNSIQHNVNFTNDTTLRTAEGQVYKAGQTIPGITDDFDGYTRPTPPSIGAVEVTPYDLEATSATTTPLPFLINTNHTISFTITNVRDMPFTNPNVYFKRKGTSTPIASEIATTTINPGGTYVHNFTTPYMPTSLGNDTLLVWLSHIDDKNTVNDTFVCAFRVEYLDVALTQIVNPNANVLEGSTNTVTVKLKNNSSYKVYDIPVSYQINALAPVNEMYTDTLDPGEIANYSFTTSYVPAMMGTDQITAYVGHPRDQLRKNDTLRINIGVDRKDIAVTTLNNPLATPTVLPLFSQHQVKVYLRNPGSLPMSLSQVSYQEVGKPAITEPYVGSVLPNDSVLFTFSALYMPTTGGTKTFKVWAKTTGDMVVSNDTLIKTLTVASGNSIDVSPSSLNSPKFITIGTNTISAYIRNMGLVKLDSVTISYQVDANPVVTEKFIGSVNAGDSVLYTFTTPANISNSSARICVFTDNPNGLLDIDKTNDTLCKTIQISSLADNITGLDAWNVYPNPVQDVVNIQLSLNTPQNIVIQVVDVTGKVLQSENYVLGNGSHVVSQDISKLPAGMYVLRMLNDNNSVQKNIIVIK